MEVFEIRRPQLEREASVGPLPGGSKVSFLLILASIILITSGVLIILHFAVEYKKISNEILFLHKSRAEKLSNTSCERQHCNSKECVSIASRLLSMMDETANPCEDFYEYACGGYRQMKAVPFAHTSYSPAKEAQLDLLIDVRKMMEATSTMEESITLGKMKQFYKTCMNGTERDKQQKTSLDEWFAETELLLQNLEFGEEGRTGSWRQLLSRLEEYRIHTVLEPTFRDSQQSPIERIEVDCIAPLLPVEVYINSTDEFKAYKISIYKIVIEEAFTILSIDKTKRQELISWILQIEADIARSFQTSDTSESLQISDEHKQQVRDIWRPVIGDAVQELEVVSTCKYDLQNLFTIMNNSPPQMSYAYITWRMLLQLMPFMGTQLRHLHVNFISHLIGLDSVYRSQWQECSDVIREEFGLATLKGLVDKGYIKSGEIKMLNRIFLDVKKSFAFTIGSMNDVEPRIRRMFLDKLNSMVLDTGYQGIINKKSVLDTVYSDLEIGDNYFKNIITLKKFKARYFLTRLWYGNPDDPISVVSLERNPLGNAASYDYITNTINIDYGLFRPPVYWFLRSNANYLKYGLLAMLAREMSHAFDSTGRYYDGSGSQIEKHFWPKIIKEKYESIVKCFRHQILKLDSRFHAYVNNTVTLNNFMADLGSFLFNYKALSAHLRSAKDKTLPGVSLTEAQTFFVQTAQMYCELRKEASSDFLPNHLFTGKYRVNMAALNLREFRNAFHCSEDKVVDQPLNCNFLLT